MVACGAAAGMGVEGVRARSPVASAGWVVELSVRPEVERKGGRAACPAAAFPFGRTDSRLGRTVAADGARRLIRGSITRRSRGWRIFGRREYDIDPNLKAGWLRNSAFPNFYGSAAVGRPGASLGPTREPCMADGSLQRPTIFAPVSGDHQTESAPASRESFLNTNRRIAIA